MKLSFHKIKVSSHTDNKNICTTIEDKLLEGGKAPSIHALCPYGVLKSL